MTDNEIKFIEGLVEEYRIELIRRIEQSKKSCLIGATHSAFTMYAETIADYFCVDVEHMLSKKTRRTDVKKGRQILWWICRIGESSLELSLSSLGDKSGGFNHATVGHGIKVVSNDLDYDIIVKKDVTSILRILGFTLEKVGMNYTTKK